MMTLRTRFCSLCCCLPCRPHRCCCFAVLLAAALLTCCTFALSQLQLPKLASYYMYCECHHTNVDSIYSSSTHNRCWQLKLSSLMCCTCIPHFSACAAAAAACNITMCGASAAPLLTPS
jgi:hypothetical protein